MLGNAGFKFRGLHMSLLLHWLVSEAWTKKVCDLSFKWGQEDLVLIPGTKKGE